jgi:hypothetical protein
MADGEDERRPHLVERHEGEHRVEPDVHVGEPATDVHEHVRADHQPEAHRAGARHLAAEHLPEDDQHDDGRQLPPQQQAAHTTDHAHGGQDRQVQGEDGGDDPVPREEARLVEAGSARDAGPEAGRPGRRRSVVGEGGHAAVIGRGNASLTQS